LTEVFDRAALRALDSCADAYFYAEADEMETVEASAPTLILTDAAAKKVGDLIRGEGNPKLMLRVFVQGGGCSGLSYGFEFDEQIGDGDTCVENLGVKLLVDPMSVQYLTGAEIDYREGLDGAQFVIRNPQASTTCGCGSSFSV
jgi:iron-sulfur cluster insertion protein